jgi:O-antigen ligase
MYSRHRVLLAILLVGNAVAFAGVDAPTRLVTVAIVLVLMMDLHRMPTMPAIVHLATFGFMLLVVMQLAPLPEAVRRLIQPGFAEVMRPGWAPLSLAPWSTILVAAAAVVVVGIVLTAARMAATRSGLPILLGIIAGTGAVIAVLGLAGEAGAPENVLLIRANTGGGDVYGSFVNSNHFAAGIELSLPAALVLLAASVRNLPNPGSGRQRAAVLGLGTSVVIVVAVAAVLRSSSRGGILFLAAGLLLTAGLWVRPRSARRWPWLVGIVAFLGLILALAWTRLPELRDGFSELFVIEGVEGNTRWDLWTGTVQSFARSPVVGSGLGSYRHVIAIDKPATGTAVLEQAHNDWLEWLSTGGILGAAVLAMLIFGVWIVMRPQRVRRLRFDLRYPLAGAAAALAATALHEIVGFGLQTPVNRYLLAAWIGLVWGVWARVEEGKRRSRTEDVGHLDAAGSSEIIVEDLIGDGNSRSAGQRVEPESPLRGRHRPQAGEGESRRALRASNGIEEGGDV